MAVDVRIRRYHIPTRGHRTHNHTGPLAGANLWPWQCKALGVEEKPEVYPRTPPAKPASHTVTDKRRVKLEKYYHANRKYAANSHHD